jgi:hypothetical protein
MNAQIRLLLLTGLAALTLAGCGGDDSGASTPAAPATTASAAAPIFISGPAAPSGKPVRGIPCESSEGVATHLHPGLAIVLGGKKLTIPSDIGIDTRRACLYWLHTHRDQGVLHVESPLTGRTFVLGDFFAVWGYPVGKDGVLNYRGPVRAWVDGKPWTDDPANIPLSDRQTIVLSDAQTTEMPTVDFSELDG